jgi:hypothetical protein
MTMELFIGQWLQHQQTLVVSDLGWHKMTEACDQG